MKVLGISPLDKDSTVTIVEDGVITYAAAEERFTREKLQDGFPWQSLADALERTGTKAEEIDKVVYPFLPYDEETRLFERNLQREREFLEDTETAATTEAIARAKSRIPARREPIRGREAVGHGSARSVFRRGRDESRRFENAVGGVGQQV